MLEQSSSPATSQSIPVAARFSQGFSSWQILVVLGLLGLILYGASLNDGYQFDDDLILNDSNVTNAERWNHFFNPLYLRQLTFFSFYLNYQLGGEDALGFHAINLALHLANVFLLFYLVLPMVGVWMAGVAASIFLAHPVQIESVVYVYQRSTLLGTFFGLIGLILMSSAATMDGSRTPSGEEQYGQGRMFLAGVMFLLAFEGKESALALPLLMVLFGGLKSRLTRWIVSFVALLSMAALGILARLGEETVGFGTLDEVGPWSYFLTEVRVFYTYLRLLVAPYPQSLEYEFEAVESVFQLQVLGGLIGLCVLAGTAVWLLRHPRYHWAGVGAASFFVLLAPTSSVIPSLDFAFEHRLYMPMLGFSLFAAFWLSRLKRRNVVVVVIVLLLGSLTLNRGRVWASEVTLWEDTVLKAPGKARAWFNLGGAHLETNPVRAREAFLKVIELGEELPEALYNLGVIEQGEGDSLGALDWYQRALGEDPGYWPAINNSGNVRFALGDYGGAIENFEQTLVLNPDYWPAQYNLAIVYTAIGRPDRAVPKLRIVLDWSPEFVEARYLLAVSLDRLGRGREAAEQRELLAGDLPATGFRDEDGLMPLPATN